MFLTLNITFKNRWLQALILRAKNSAKLSYTWWKTGGGENAQTPCISSQATPGVIVVVGVGVGGGGGVGGGVYGHA